MSKLTDPLSMSNANFANPRGNELFERLTSYHDWLEARINSGYFPYARTLTSKPTPVADIGYMRGFPKVGINLAVQDYLGLTSHEAVKDEATKAIHDFGLHSAGSAMLLGNNPYSLKLEADLSNLLQMDHILLFPTGWGAGYGLIRGLIRQNDHVVIDNLAHACLQEGARSATNNVHRFRHLCNESLRATLSQIRHSDRVNAILVVTEGIFSMDSDSPNIETTQALCREFDAKLVVDVAHDLGALGPGGLGALGMQGLVGKVDLVIGAFSKTFASNGGFIATNDPRVKNYLRWFANPHTFSNAMSPVQCATVSKCIDIISSDEGRSRRENLSKLSVLFRDKLTEYGCEVLGSPSAIIPVMIGRESDARVASKKLSETHVFANMIEFPAVGLRQARFRCQIMATHETEHLEAAAKCIADALMSNNDTARFTTSENMQNGVVPSMS